TRRPRRSWSLRTRRRAGLCFFFSSRRRHTSFSRDWSSDVCSSDLNKDDPRPLAHVHSILLSRRGRRPKVPGAPPLAGLLGQLVHVPLLPAGLLAAKHFVVPLPQGFQDLAQVGSETCREIGQFVV